MAGFSIVMLIMSIFVIVIIISDICYDMPSG